MGKPKKSAENQTEEPMEGTEVECAVPQTSPDERFDVSELEALRREIAQLRARTENQPVQSDSVVELTFLAAVSPDNVTSLGDYGSLNGVGGCIEVPRKEFGGRFLTPVVRSLLRDRSLIVCSGLTETERKRYGVDYKDGELLDVDAFDRLLDMDMDVLTTLFRRLCPEHRQFAATRFITAYERGDNRVSREKVESLNDISRETDPKGLFSPILEGMNKT